ncbi:MAG TPA: Gldg family protein [Rudaea sp.]|nr:Gldg family protein [Rudaea sp.]
MMWRKRIGDWLFTLLLLAAALMLAFLSTRYGMRHDFSYAQRASLDQRTVQLLHKLTGPVTIDSYSPQDNQLRGAIADFIIRYERIKPDIHLRFIDPDADPAATREAGIQVNGELVIHYNGRREQLKVLTERSFDDALLRLLRARSRLVAFLSGDGERRPDGKANADLGNFTALLQAQGVRALELNLATTRQIPQNIDLLVIASPQALIAPEVTQRLVDYVETGGNLLWLTEPDTDVGLGLLAKTLSVHVLPGVAVDGASAAYRIGDPSFIAIASYPHDSITQDFDLTTLFPQAAALAQLAEAQWKLIPLLRTGPKSWNHVGTISRQGEPSTISFDAAKGEIPGPLDLGFALTRLSPSPAKREQRVVVIGDGDFVSNAFLGNGGNRELGQRVFDWLLHDDALIEIPDKIAPDRHLALSQRALGMIGFGFLLALPGFLLIAGGVVWWRRRRA